MYLVVRASDKKILLSSFAPVDETVYSEEQGFEVYELPDDQYSPEMVGGILSATDSVSEEV